MAQSIRPDAGIEIASIMLDDIQYQRSRYYYFLGNIESWDSTGIDNGSGDIAPEPGSELDPLTQTEEASKKIRSEIAYVKRVSPNEVTLVTRRVNWINGNIYDFWDHTTPMSEKDFYVVTDDYNVYKCLDNNNGAPSTVKPTGNSVYPLTTSDGYVWKYMYNIPPFKRSRFMSVNYMPVQKALSDSFYNNGAIDDAVVLNAGSGYTDVPSTVITVPSNGYTTGSGAVVSSIVIDNGTSGVGAITSITVAAGGTGTGYTKGVRVVISGTGTGARAHAVVGTGATAGKIISVVIDDPGFGYSAGTTVTFTTGGAIVHAAVSPVDGSIIATKIIDPGVGYNDNQTIPLTVTGTGGSGLYGNSTAVLKAVAYNGEIKHINIIDPGKNYPAYAATYILAAGDGEGASFSPIIYGGKIIDVFVDNAGTGYTAIDLSVVSSTGTGASVQGVISQSDYTSDQMVIEQVAIPGAIHYIHVADGGKNYSPNDSDISVSPRTVVTVEGDGDGCVARAVVGSGGVIESIKIIEPGSGYNYANIVITDLDRPGGIIPSGEAAVVYAVLPPIGGHGSDATKELFANTLSIATSLRGELEVEEVAQEFRTYGVIRNPTNIFTRAKYQAANALLAYKMEFSSTAGLTLDDVLITESNSRYRVLAINSNIVSLLPIDSTSSVAPLGILRSTTTTQEFLSSETIQSFDFDKYSGALLYVSTENPFIFTPDQSLTIKTYVKF